MIRIMFLLVRMLALARALIALFPALPIEEEGRLNDPLLRDNFIERVYVYSKWRAIRKKLTPKKLIEFHQRHKYSLMAHSQVAYKNLGQMIAETSKKNLEVHADEYIDKLMSVFKKIATRKNHACVLQHICGYFKKNLDKSDKGEFLGMVDDYRLGHLPLIVPIKFIYHFAKKFPKAYLENQSYFEPYPEKLKLRNFI